MGNVGSFIVGEGEFWDFRHLRIRLWALGFRFFFVLFFVLNLPPFTDLCMGNDKSLCFCFFIGQTKPLQLYLFLSQFWADLSFHDFLCLPERVQFLKSWLLTEHTVSPDSWDYKWQTTSQFHYKWAQGEEGLLRGWRVARKGGLSVPFQICTFAKGS